MDKCIQSILVGGEDVEIIIVDDGSTKDKTSEIADSYAEKYPTIVKVVHQENGGHGDAVTTGIQNATGRYFKVVDSDDWVDEKAYRAILAKLKEFDSDESQIDMLLSNYVYEKVGAKHKKVMKQKGFPKNQVFTWDEVGHISKGHYILMHSVIYRTQMLKDINLTLPKHTFYVDNLYVYKPMPYVKKMYYLDVDFYRYFIGRDDQSVNESVMIGRLDQQLRVNKIMLEDVNLRKVRNKKCRMYMFSYLDIITTVTSILCIKSGTPEHLKMKKDLWNYIREYDEGLYKMLRRSILGIGMNLPGKAGRKIAIFGYNVANKIVGFN